MDGYELCKTVKSKIEFCHIPVILLTALNGTEKQITGVEHGADAYIAKPFNVKLLLTSIENLIENRKRIKQSFSQSTNLPEHLNISMLDKDFMQKVNQIIEANLDNSSLKIEDIAKELGLSIAQFSRKFKQLTGQLPNRYLKNYRLQIAANIIRKDPWVSLKTVMYDVGLESASHFSRSFKDKFGETPKSFAKKLM